MDSNFSFLKDVNLIDAFKRLHENESMVLKDQHDSEKIGLNFRKFLENILHIELKRHSSFKPESHLFETIKSIDENWPRCWVLSHFHDIRMAGNKAAHEDNYKISKSKIISLLKASHNVLIWYLQDVVRADINFSDFDEEIYQKDIQSEKADKVSLSQECRVEALQESGIKLNKKQQSLAGLFTGRHFVNAPPGTGKTELLTQRFGKALELFEEDEIICLTFTSRAAFEMVERMRMLIGEHNVSINNFHSWCWLNLNNNISKVHKRFRNLSLLDDEFREKLIFMEWEKIYVDTGVLTLSLLKQCLGNVFSLIIPFSILRHEDDELVALAEHQWEKGVGSIINSLEGRNKGLVIDKSIFVEELERLLDAFQNRKENIRAIDFDDIIAQNLMWLSNNPQMYKCIQVDEVQDLNIWQWYFIKLISSEDANVFATGDIDQSIYSFLGADIKLLNEYTDAFEVHHLSENYRSNESIINFLNSYKNVNFNNENKIIATKKNSANEPATLLLQTKNNRTEIELISRAAKKVLSDPSRQVGILCQNNNQVNQIADALQRESISSFRVSQFDFMHHPIINDFISFMKSFTNVATLLDWYRLVYRVGMGCSKSYKQTDAIKYVDALKSMSVIPSDLVDYINDVTDVSSYDYCLKELVRFYNDKSVVVFDTETTDLDVTNASVIQLSAVKLQGGQVVSEFDRYVNLDRADPATLEKLNETSEIHGITESILNEKGEDFAVVLNDFINYIDDSFLVAHNLNYDVAVMERYISKYDNKNKDVFLNKFTEAVQNRSADTLKLSRQLYPLQKSYKLGDLLESFSLEGTNSHNALDDVKATASLLNKIISDIKPTLGLVDSFIDENEKITHELQRQLKSLNQLFFKSNINYGGVKSSRVTLNGLLQIWLAYVEKMNGWYDPSIIEKIRIEIDAKLYPWLVENTESDVNRYLLSVLNDELNKLSFLKEADLIVPGRDKVVVSTIHRSKGLAFDTVIIPSVIDDYYPRFFSKTKDEIDEDKRLLYVAASRPKKKMIMIYYTEKQPLGTTRKFPTGLSRFIEPITESFDYVKSMVAS